MSTLISLVLLSSAFWTIFDCVDWRDLLFSSLLRQFKVAALNHLDFPETSSLAFRYCVPLFPGHPHPIQLDDRGGGNFPSCIHLQHLSLIPWIVNVSFQLLPWQRLLGITSFPSRAKCFRYDGSFSSASMFRHLTFLRNCLKFSFPASFYLFSGLFGLIAPFKFVKWIREVLFFSCHYQKFDKGETIFDLVYLVLYWFWNNV